MAKSHLNYLGNGKYKMDGVIYDTSKTVDLLKDWKCPHCNHSQLSYKDHMTEEEHFPVCKGLKRKRKALAKKKLNAKQSNTLITLGIIKK